YDLIIQEQKLWPDWNVREISISSSDIDLSSREQQERDLADSIVCGSEFVKQSLVERGNEDKKINVVPLGKTNSLSQVDFVKKTTPREQIEGLRVLFAGQVSLRKGIPYLLEALQMLEGKYPVTCKIAGSIAVNPKILRKYGSLCDFLGQVPRSEMKKLYQWADVFVLPSIIEGSAMVTYEAMCYGLPIITTYNSGSIVRDGIDGYIVPLRDSEAIAEKLRNLYINDGVLNKDIRRESVKSYMNNLFQASTNTLIDLLQY
ncbi:MAG: glycosyltransferase family 4 protein, partial [Cyanobacteria bacterium J06649_11]